MSDNPYLQYAPGSSANPYEKYRQRLPVSMQSTGPIEAMGAGLQQGIVEPGMAVAQGMARLRSSIPFMPAAPGASPQDIDTQTRQQQQTFEANPAVQQHPLLAGGARLGGNLAITAPLNMIPGLGGAQTALRTGAGLIGRGAALGAMGGALSPVTGGDYWSEKAKQVGLGAGIGAAVPGVGSAIAPRLPAPQLLNQAFRPLWNFFTGAEERTVEGFDRTVARQVLDPIGGTIPRNVKGHALVDLTENQISKAYDQVLPHLQLNTFNQADLLAHNPELAMTVSELGVDEARQFDTIMSNRVFNKFAGRGVVDGTVIKDMQKDLGRRAISFLGGNNDDLGHALLEARQTLNSMVAQQNPAQASALARADEAWKMYARMRAASSGATSLGKFSPSDLLRAVRREDRSAGKGMFSKGDALLQGYAETGLQALGTRRSSAWELAKVFSGKGLLAELGRDIAQPVGRGMKAATPFAAAPTGLIGGRMENKGKPPVTEPADRPLRVGPIGF